MTETPLSHVRRLIDPDRRDLWTLLVYASGVGLLTLAIPVAVQALVETVAFGAMLQPLAVLALLLFAGLAFAATLRGLEVWVLERMTQRLFVRVATRVVSTLTRARSGARAPEARWELVNRFFDVLSAQKALVKLLSDGLAVSLQTVIGLVALSLYHPWLLGFGLLLALALLGILAGLGKGGASKSLRESSAKYELVAWLEQIAARPTTFRGTGRHFAENVAHQRVRAWLDARRARFAVVFRQTVGTLALQVLSSVGLLALGGALVINQQLTLGQLVAAELIVTAVAAGIGKLGRSIDAAYDLSTAAAKLIHIEEALPSEPTGSVAPPPTSGGASVKLTQVSLRIDDRSLLTDATLSIAPGERIAIVGDTGSGKSAFLDLLHGDWDGESPTGIVEIDGVDLRSWDRSALRQRCALVRGHSLFAGTLSQNLSLDREATDEVAQQRILEHLGLWQLLGSDAAGLSRMLRDDGAPLPGGVILPIALGRALLGKPRLLLVDGLGELAPKMRRELLAVLLDKRSEMTVIVVATDGPWLGSFDRVLRVEDGVLGPTGLGEEAA